MRQIQTAHIFKIFLMGLLLLLVTFQCFAQTPTVLIIEAKDPTRPTFYTRDLTVLIKNRLKQHDVIRISSTSQDFETAQKEIQQEISSQVKPALTMTVQPTRIVTHLIILSPSQVLQKSESEHPAVKIFGLGSIGSQGVDSTFAETFSLLKNQLAPTATLMFDACNSFCASKSLIENVSTQLADYFGIQDGTIFAAQIKNSYTIPIDTKTIFRAKPLLLTVAAGMAISTNMTLNVWDSGTISDFIMTWAAYMPATTSLFALPVMTLIDVVKRAFKQFNEKGLFIKLTKGHVESLSAVRYTKWHSEGFPQTAGVASRLSGQIKSCAIALGGKVINAFNKIRTRKQSENQDGHN